MYVLKDFLRSRIVVQRADSLKYQVALVRS
jgi:hypothetical protein